MSKKRWGAAVCTVMLTAVLGITAAAAPSFADMAAYAWANEAVTALAEAGIINGIDGNHFAPQDNIRRADFVMMLTKTFGLQANEPEVFADVKVSPYYYSAVASAKEAGFVTGGADGRFRPNDAITRQEMFAMTYRALQQQETVQLKEAGEIGMYVDLSDAADYAVPAVIALTVNDFISGAGGYLRPKDNATRAETAVFLYRIYQKLEQ